VTRRARVGLVAALGAGVLAAVPVTLEPAHADTSTNASAQVQSLLAKVHALSGRANIAERRYQRALNAVADSVNQAITLDQASTAVGDRADAAHAALVARVQGLYETGDDLVAAASLVTTGSFAAYYDRNELASRAMSAQISSVQDADSAAVAAQNLAVQAEKQEHLKIGTARDVAAAASKVVSLLNQQKVLLKKADKHLAAVKKAEAALAAQTSSFAAITTASVAGLHLLPPSAQYLALYKAAAPTCPGLSWTVLASIGQVESGHGRNPSTSSAGAMGPMQFEPATFASYAVDGDHDGSASIMDPADAIFTAAHYLCANGAGFGPHALAGAILHYNHAVWYVDMVLTLSKMYASSYPA
jgi:Transglycosylase SLT domain